MIKFAKIVVSIITTTALAATAVGGSVAYATSTLDSHDTLVWSESESEDIVKSYNEWEHTGTATIYGYNGQSVIGKQVLDSYRYENYDDQKKAKAEVNNYKYVGGNNPYSYGWNNATDCYCRARVEAANGYVYTDSGRQFGKYFSTAQSPGVSVGICKTYCGNLAAD